MYIKKLSVINKYIFIPQLQLIFCIFNMTYINIRIKEIVLECIRTCVYASFKLKYLIIILSSCASSAFCVKAHVQVQVVCHSSKSSVLAPSRILTQLIPMGVYCAKRTEQLSGEVTPNAGIKPFLLWRVYST